MGAVGKCICIYHDNCHVTEKEGECLRAGFHFVAVKERRGWTD